MRRPLTATALAGLVACFAVLAVGCGSSGSEATESSPAESAGRQNTPPASTPGSQAPTTTAPSQGSGQEGGSGEGGPGSSSAPSTSGSGSPSYKPDRSLQTFGTQVGGARRSEVAHALLSFFAALANQDYTKVCAGITRKNREALEVFMKAKHESTKSCSEFLPTILPPPDRETKQAAHATITHVRVKGKDAIIFFRPQGGKVRYIAMTREDGRWKSLTLVAGTPLNPLGP